MMFAPTFTLAEANALVPYIAEEVARLRGAILRAKEIDAVLEQTAAAHAAEPHGAAAQADTALTDERAALEGEVKDAVAALARAGATVRLDPPGVDVAARRGNERVRLHFLEGNDTFTLWRDEDGRLHTIDDDDDFGEPLPQ